MRPLFCQKGFAPIILIIIVLGLGLMGTIAYSPLKIQVEKIITNPQTEKDSSENGTEAEKVVNKTKGSEDGAEAETSVTEKASNDEIAQKDQIVKEDEKNKTEEKDQEPEGIEDEPPVNTTFKVLDFSKFYKPITLLLTPTPTATPFVNSNVVGNVSRIKIPALITSSPKPTPTSTPKPTPTPPKKAIVVILDTVKTEYTGDLIGNGEIQIVSSTKSGSAEQVNAWPYKNWDEADAGNILKINQPIFIFPKESMGDKLALWVTVVENDSLPSSAQGLIKKAADISNGSYDIYQNPALISSDTVYDQTISKYIKWLEGSEHFGTLARVFYKSDNFGLGTLQKKSYTIKKKAVTLTYSIREVTVPEKPLKVNITVKKIKAGKSAGDTIILGFSVIKSGDLYVWTNAFDGFLNKDTHGLTKRIPEKGEKKLAADTAWDINTNIFSGKVTGPIIYYEVGVWDKDDKSNDDQLEIVSDTLYMADYKPGDVIQTSEDGDDGISASGTIKREIRFSAAD